MESGPPSRNPAECSHRVGGGVVGSGTLHAVFALVALMFVWVQSATACPLARTDALGNEARRCSLIAAGVQANLDGRFSEAEAAWASLHELDPTDPAAPLWEVETAWWRLLNDEGATANDAIVRASANEAIQLADARLKIKPDDAVALGQKGTAFVHLARLDGVRGSLVAAGRQGERGRELLERSLEFDPNRFDSRYALGLYSYYASVMPGFLKWVSWLWFVPKGDRVAGLQGLQAVSAVENDHATDAQFILMNIRTYHAPLDLPYALEMGRSLHARYPENALFHSELIEVLLLIGLYDEAIETAKALEDKRPVEPEAQTRPGLARILRAQGVLLSGRADEAWEILAPMDEETFRMPIWGGAYLHLVRAQVHDARGERAAAIVEYDRVIDRKGARHNRRAAMIAQRGLETPFEPTVYRELPMISAAPD